MDLDTFLTAVYVFVDDVYRERFGRFRAKRRGRPPLLSDSEVLTLALLAQWHGRGSERSFLRFAAVYWRAYFPRIGQSGFNKRVRALRSVLAMIAVDVGRRMARVSGAADACEAMDGIIVPLMRCCRGERRRLFTPEEADIGRGGSDKRWEYGVKLLAAVDEQGCINGFVVGPAGTEERWLAEALLSWRKDPSAPQPSPAALADALGPAHRSRGRRLGPAGPLWPREGAGEPTGKDCLADKGFAGRGWQEHWSRSYQTRVVTPADAPSAGLSVRELNSKRQIVETAFNTLSDLFHLRFPRARTMPGLVARISAKIAALNMGILINQLYGRAPLAIFNPIG